MAGGPEEGSSFYVVNPAEYVPFGPYNVSYPKPVDFMRMFIDPGMDVCPSLFYRLNSSHKAAALCPMVTNVPLKLEGKVVFQKQF